MRRNHGSPGGIVLPGDSYTLFENDHAQSTVPP
jgi:hypothetical protein